MNSTLERRSNGTYAPGISGNPNGRPAGIAAFKHLLTEKLPPEDLLTDAGAWELVLLAARLPAPPASPPPCPDSHL